MCIKSKVKFLLGDLLIKRPISGYKDRVFNKQLIKNVVDEDFGELLGGRNVILRVLATNNDNAKRIEDVLKQHLNDLPIESIFVVDETGGRSVRPVRSGPVHGSSVLIKVQQKASLESITSVLHSSTEYSQSLREAILETELTHGHKTPSKIVIDFSSPNIAKPFHFGHLKSTILGNFLANLHQYIGDKVTRLNYIGDWGTQYGLLSLGLEQSATEDSNTTEPNLCLKRVLESYVKANELGECDNEFYERAKLRFQALEYKDDPELLKKWNHLKQLSMEELRRSYSILGVRFDAFEFESDFADYSKEIVKQMDQCKFTRTLEDGVKVAQIVKNNKMIEVPVQKSDGTSLYVSRDVAAAIKRKEKFNFDRMLYVVGADQEKHFHCVIEMLHNMNYEWARDEILHVKMGKVLGMSTRSGKYILLSDIIEEATAQFIKSTRNTPTTKVKDETEVEYVGRNLALAALFVFDMRNLRTKHYEFDWSQVMSANTRSGINFQTTLARLASLLTNAKSQGIEPIVSREDKLDAESVGCVEGSSLISIMDELDSALHHSYWSLDPSALVNHGLRLCRAINRARRSDSLRVLDEQDEVKARTRVSLFKCSFIQLEFIIKMIGLQPLYKV